jgi:hypothetical protein
MTSKLNAILAWMLAFGLTFVPISFVLSTVIDLYAPVSTAGWTTGMAFGAWAIPSLLITAIVVRPVENFTRRHGYGFPPVETARGLGGGEDSGDAISSAAERALTEAVDRELVTRATKRPDS